MHTAVSSSHIPAAARRLLTQSLDTLIAQSTHQLLQLEPHYAAIGKKSLGEQMRKNLSLTLWRLTGDPLPADIQLAAFETGQIRALQQVDLIAVSRSFRIDLRVLWEAFLEDAATHAPESYSEYVAELLQVWEAVESNINEMTEGYRQTAELMRQQNTELRAAAFQRLLSSDDAGNPVAVARHLRTLTLDPELPFICVVSDLRESQFAELSATQARLTTHGVSHYFGWHGQHFVALLQPSRTAEEEVSALLPELTEFRTAIAPVHTTAGLRDAIRNASLLVSAATAPGIKLLRDHWLEAFTEAEPTLAHALAEELFAPFLSLTDYVREELTRIIAGYFATNGSIAAIGEVTFRHRNTVRNRLAQIEELTGLDLRRPRDSALLALAFESWKRKSHQPHARQG